jgi:PncC family amidohydrolase
LKKTELLIGESLRERGLTLALAESCTGGLLSSRITDVPRSSEYFLGSIVAYANGVKVSGLGVRASTLKRYGAVSKETASEMARGVKKSLGAGLTAAITGIAGPGGGTPEKPVGLVFIAVSKGRTTEVKRFVFKGGRKSIKKQSAEAALSMLAEALGLKT